MSKDFDKYRGTVILQLQDIIKYQRKAINNIAFFIAKHVQERPHGNHLSLNPDELTELSELIGKAQL